MSNFLDDKFLERDYNCLYVCVDGFRILPFENGCGLYWTIKRQGLTVVLQFINGLDKYGCVWVIPFLQPRLQVLIRLLLRLAVLALCLPRLSSVIQYIAARRKWASLVFYFLMVGL
jgi:hypothetical protein